MNLRNFFAELRRRNVYKVAVAYAVAGWVIAQIATQIFPFLEIPNWIVRLVILLIAIGFPIALIIAWAFEATPEGIKRTEVADAMPTTKSHKKHAWVFVVIIGAALSVGLFFFGRYSVGTKTTPRQIDTATASEIPQEIADSLQAKLSPAEATKLATAPTNDTAAYDLFLKGEFEQRVANSNFRPESFDQATVWYKEAIARDPNFALAIAQLAICRLRRHWLTDPLTEAEVIDAGKMAKQALTLAPDLAEAHIAVGLFHYYGFREYEPALTEFKRALQLQPNNALALSFVAFVHRRQGKWDLTLDELKKSIELDPRNPYTIGGVAETDIFLRMWKEAEDFARRGLTIDPHESTCMRMLLLSSLNQTGNAQEPLRLLATFPPDDLLLPNTGMFDMVIGTRGETFVLGRDFKAALEACEIGTIARTNEWQRFAAKAGIRVLAGDVTGAQPDAEKARKLLEARQRDHPRDVRSLRALSWAYLALNRKTDAINTARRAVELLPLEKDAVLGSGNLAALAEMQAQAGAAKEAVENLRKLLSIPAGETISIARLKIDPVWDPIRNDRDFQKLLTTQEHVGP